MEDQPIERALPLRITRKHRTRTDTYTFWGYLILRVLIRATVEIEDTEINMQLVIKGKTARLNVAIEWLALLLRIQEVTGSNFGLEI
jgi:hypothetical protein